MTQSRDRLPHPLLVVDDRKDVLQALARFFQLDFELVLTAESPPEAETLLEAHRPPLVLCDYWLGDEFPPSTEFLPLWRQKYPFIRCVALMTGTKSSSIPPCSAVDDIFPKPLKLAAVVDYFRTQAAAFEEGND